MKKYSFADEPKLLKRVTVRLMLDAEKPRFDMLLETRHYLASAHMAGQTLRYVVELDDDWVAIGSFSAAALHLLEIQVKVYMCMLHFAAIVPQI